MLEKLRENALAYFQSQQRSVTKEDYIVRAYALPAKFGNIAKVHLVQDDQLSKSFELDDLNRKVNEDDIGKSLKSITSIKNTKSISNEYVLTWLRLEVET